MRDAIEERVAADPGVRAALAAIEAEDAETLADQRAVTEIAAPLHGEGPRGHWLSARFAELGLPDARTDAAGNVLVQLGEGDVSSAIMLASHLDTVFSADTDVRVHERDGRLRAPGIADNARGLAGLLRIAAVLRRHRVLRRPVLFAGTVGEEGAGDLRGVKHLFHERALRPAAFIALDGAGMRRLVHRAVGSRRFRVTVRGPGGHSWSDRGAANPLHALAAGVAALAREGGTLGRDVALNVGRMGGGTSVNAIPESAWLELDLRSESPAAIAGLEARARAHFEGAVGAPLQLAIELMGDRPAGETAGAHPLVRCAAAATAQLGVTAELASSSTDANVPMALGIPAISLGAGGEAGGTHTLGEWYRNERGAAGIQRLLLTLVAVDESL